MTRNIKTFSGAALCAKTGPQTCITGSPPDPIDVSIQVKLEAAELKIVKTTPDGKNVDGIQFHVYKDYPADGDWESVEISGSPFTTSNGGVINIPNLQTGTYYVHEIVPNEYQLAPNITATNADGKQDGAGWCYIKVTAENTHDNPTTVTFENRYAPKLTLSKSTTDGSSTAGYRFTLAQKEKDGSYTTVWSGISTESGKIVQSSGSPDWSQSEVDEFILRDGSYRLMELLKNGHEASAVKITATKKDGSVARVKEYSQKELEPYLKETDPTGERYLVFTDLEVKDLDGGHIDIQITNRPTTPNIATKAHFEDGSQTSLPLDTLVVYDDITCTNLVSGREYTITGKLMDKATGKELNIDGKTFTASKTFTANGDQHSLTTTFQIDGRKVAGKSIVVYETLTWANTGKATHKDINDANQTVSITKPQLHTTASFENGDKVSYIYDTIKIVDVVDYVNLIPQKTYTVTGTLHNKETGEPIMVDGEPLTSSVEFTPTAASGSVVVTFEFSKECLVGQTIVAFETLTFEGTELAIHADLEDEDQTVTFENPSIQTEAGFVAGLEKDEDGNDVVLLQKESDAIKDVTILDTVSYENLIPNKPADAEGTESATLDSYKLVATLLNKATGELLTTEDGAPVTAAMTFTVDEEATSGTVNVPIICDLTALKGNEIVVFEELYYCTEGREVLIASHKDAEDEKQTVRVRNPEFHTTASFESNKSHTYTLQTIKKGEKAPSEVVSVIDTVAYTDLSKNVTYVAKGTLMLTGDAPLMIDGKPVTAEAEFVPTENNGTVDVKFTFEANNLDDKSLVVFEEIYRRTVTEDGEVVDELIGEHKDMEDKDQTINFTRTVKTGGLPNWAWLAMAITLFTVAGAMLGVLVYRRRNQKK